MYSDCESSKAKNKNKNKYMFSFIMITNDLVHFLDSEFRLLRDFWASK